MEAQRIDVGLPGPAPLEGSLYKGQREAESDGLCRCGCPAAQAIRRYCHPSVIRENNRELFERLVFNIFVNNDDDHLRNHGFVCDQSEHRGLHRCTRADVRPKARGNTRCEQTTVVEL